jgi:hypothetical protein
MFIAKAIVVLAGLTLFVFFFAMGSMAWLIDCLVRHKATPKLVN